MTVISPDLVTLELVRQARQRTAAMVQPTPLVPAPWLHANAWLKLECFQTTGSFKLRGAAACLSLLPPGTGVLAVSAGNHGLAVAHAAAALGLPATIVVPASASPAKVEAIRRYPATLLQRGADYDEAEALARPLAVELGLRFVSPYNDADVIAGQGTLALELLEQQPDLEAIIIPSGGGGLLAGVAIAAQALKPGLVIYGAEPTGSPTMERALAHGGLHRIQEQPTLADGLAGNIEAGAITFPLLAGRVQEVVLVTEREIRQAMRAAAYHEHLMLEGSAAVALAAATKLGDTGQRTAVVLTGRNVALPLFLEVMASS
ncbi:MAG: Pyridoxal-5-phosphate-dependent protein beta subunit [Cyanobacteria bacterium RYN_339]|nr:Pyridoxal-5-phosphate-dependent protein beta subunit [Cyanobacteria bacterium RYN_339]